MMNSSKTKEESQLPQSKDLSTKLMESYKKEFIDECQEIIEKKEADFLRHFFKKMNIILLEEYGQEAYDDINFSKTIKEIENKVYSTLYTPMRINCQNAMVKYTKFDQLKKDESIFLTNFRPHCNNNKIPIHTCKSRFIPVYDSKGKTVYVVCVGCKHCFFESSILMHCLSCKQNTYSSVLAKNDTMLHPATWEKYHCNAVMNEKMHCIKCQDVFYLKNEYLFCKKCKFLVQPLDVIWRCLICVKEFKSHAKIYNPLEFKVFKLAIKSALLYKVIVKPKELPCKCDMNPLSLEYNHKTTCQGVLYHGKLNNHHIVVCSQCKAIATLNKFQWKCPKCLQVFITSNVKLIDQEENKLLLLQRNESSNKESKVAEKKCIQEALSYIKKDSANPNTSIKPNIPNINLNNVSQFRSSLGLSKNSNKSTIFEEQSQRIPAQRRNYSTNYKESDLQSKRFHTLDDDEPYYSNNKIHSHKKNEMNLKQYQLKDNEASSIGEKNIIEDHQPALKCYYKNLYGNIPKKMINLEVPKQLERMNSSIGKKNNAYEQLNPLTLSAEMSTKNKRYSNNDNQFQFNSQSRSPNPGLRSSNKFIKKTQNDIKNSSLFSSEVKEQIISVKEEEVVRKGFLSKSLISFTKDTNGKDNSFCSPLSKNPFNLRFDSNKQNDSHKNLDMIEKNVEKIENNGKSDSYKNVEKINKSERIEMNENNDMKFKKINDISNPIESTIHVENESDKDKDKEPTMEIINSEDYTIITQLGQGTFGKIYLVQDKQQNIFSLKKIILTEELDIESILKEYQLCYCLQHDNIIKIIGYQQTKLDFNTYAIYILMEVGLSDWEKEIKTHIDKKLFYTEKEIVNILFQLVSALAFLQRKNVSHRDIKPQNVLKFKKNIYKLADFGEAKQLQKSGINNQVSTLRGTELYMSPLLFNGLKTNQLDIKHNLCKSDVFSLGLCFVYAMTLSSSHIYEIRKIVDSKNIRSFLKILFKEKYSTKLLDLIGDMLEINEKNRMDFIELEVKISSIFLRD